MDHTRTKAARCKPARAKKAQDAAARSGPARSSNSRDIADGNIPRSKAGDPPFMLQPAVRFPEDVLIPKARGAAIVSVLLPAESRPMLPAIAPAEAEPAPENRAARRRAARAARQPVPGERRAPARAAAPQPESQLRAGTPRRKSSAPSIVSDAAADPAIATTPMPVAISAAAPAAAAASVVAGLVPPEACLAPATMAAPLPPPPIMPLSPSRAPIVVDGGLIGRLVGWLTRLAPRKRRTPLPRARTRMPVAAPAAPPQDDALARQMLLQLSEENARLRRELDRLRAATPAVPA